MHKITNRVTIKKEVAIHKKELINKELTPSVKTLYTSNCGTINHIEINLTKLAFLFLIYTKITSLVMMI